MFNRNLANDNAAQKEIVQNVVSSALGPGIQESNTNTAGAAGGAYNTLSPFTGDPDNPDAGDDGSGAFSGVDANGNATYPFIMGVDSLEDEGAHIPFGYPTQDYTF